MVLSIVLPHLSAEDYVLAETVRFYVPFSESIVVFALERGDLGSTCLWIGVHRSRVRVLL